MRSRTTTSADGECRVDVAAGDRPVKRDVARRCPRAVAARRARRPSVDRPPPAAARSRHRSARAHRRPGIRIPPRRPRRRHRHNGRRRSRSRDRRRPSGRRSGRSQAQGMHFRPDSVSAPVIDGDDARRLLGAARVDAADASVAVHAAEDGGVDHSWQRKVSRVTRRAGQQPGVLAPADTRSKNTCWRRCGRAHRRPPICAIRGSAAAACTAWTMF